MRQNAGPSPGKAEDRIGASLSIPESLLKETLRALEASIRCISEEHARIEGFLEKQNKDKLKSMNSDGLVDWPVCDLSTTSMPRMESPDLQPLPPTMPWSSYAVNGTQASPTSMGIDNLPGGVSDEVKDDRGEDFGGRDRSIDAMRTSGASITPVQEGQHRTDTALWSNTEEGFSRYARISMRKSMHQVGDKMKNAMTFQQKGRNRANVFPDPDAMKKEVRAQILSSGDTCVYDLFEESGWCQAVARSTAFEIFEFAIIVTNALWLAYEASLNDDDILVQAEVQFQVGEQLYCCLFSIDWFIRVFAYRNKVNCLTDKWLVFDTFLLATMVLETWILSMVVFLTNRTPGSAFSGTSVLKVVKLVRLSRVARVGRIFRAFPEAMFIVKSLVIVFRTVVLIVFVLLMIIYVFAILLVQLAKGTYLRSKFFRDVPFAMYQLLLGAVFPDVAPFARELGAEGYLFGIVFMTFVVLSSVVVMNMLIGALVEVVSAVASVEREEHQSMEVKEQLLNMLYDIDQNSDSTMSKDEFNHMVRDPYASKALHEVGVDPLGLIETVEPLFKLKDTIGFKDMLELMLEFRGGNPAKVKDLVHVRRYLYTNIKKIGHHGGDGRDSWTIPAQLADTPYTRS